MKQAICNEMYGERPLAEVCRSVRSIGYAGIEISPFTLAPCPADISAVQRREYRDIIAASGLGFVGLHWLMFSPPGLHVTGPDRALRERSWRHIDELIDLCADLGENGVMVFGSPKQRSTTAGATVEEATRRMEEGLAEVSSHAMQRGVTILLEALPGSQADVVRTLEEAVRIVRSIASPAIGTMFDTHNAEDETEPHAGLIDRYFDYIRHIHVNERDGRRPGTGGYDFAAVLNALKRRNYGGWVSLEVFDFSEGAGNIARESLRYLKSVTEQLAE